MPISQVSDDSFCGTDHTDTVKECLGPDRPIRLGHICSHLSTCSDVSGHTIVIWLELVNRHNIIAKGINQLPGRCTTMTMKDDMLLVLNWISEYLLQGRAHWCQTCKLRQCAAKTDNQHNAIVGSIPPNPERVKDFESKWCASSNCQFGVC